MDRNKIREQYYDYLSVEERDSIIAPFDKFNSPFLGKPEMLYEEVVKLFNDKQFLIFNKDIDNMIVESIADNVITIDECYEIISAFGEDDFMCFLSRTIIQYNSAAEFISNWFEGEGISAPETGSIEQLEMFITERYEEFAESNDIIIFTLSTGKVIELLP